MKKTLLAAAVLLGLTWPGRARAIELELEENKAERGNIGFVDTQRLFKLFPETIKAKENFEEAVRQAEDQINLRKADVLRLRKEIDSIKVEREAIARSTLTPVAVPQAVSTQTAVAVPLAVPPAVSTRTAVAAPLAVSTAAAQAAAAPALHLSTAAASAPALNSISTATLAQLPGFVAARPALSSAAASQPLVINLPGATTGPMVIAPPAKALAPPPAAPAAVPLAAAPPALPPVAPPAVSTAAATAAALAAARAEQAALVAALDEKIAQKTRELERKQAQARDEQASAEKNLLDLESRRSEILLGKIYKAVQEVARKEGISVVVDKTGILYGHNAVDLTEKVLKYLKGG